MVYGASFHYNPSMKEFTMARQTISALKEHIAQLEAKIAEVTSAAEAPAGKKTKKVSRRCVNYSTCYSNVMVELPIDADGRVSESTEEPPDYGCDCSEDESCGVCGPLKATRTKSVVRCSSCQRKFEAREKLRSLDPPPEVVDELLKRVNAVLEVYNAWNFGDPDEREQAQDFFESEQALSTPDSALKSLWEFKRNAMKAIMDRHVQQAKSRAADILFAAWKEDPTSVPITPTPVRLAVWLIERDDSFRADFEKMEAFGLCVEEHLKRISLLMKKRILRFRLNESQANGQPASNVLALPAPKKPTTKKKPRMDDDAAHEDEEDEVQECPACGSSDIGDDDCCTACGKEECSA